MKSHHPEYLESFVKTCMAYGLDEEATTMLLDNARHKDYLENSPEYREGFQSTVLEARENNPLTKVAFFMRAFPRNPNFWKGVASVPVVYGVGKGVKSLWDSASNAITNSLDQFGLGRAINRGDIPNLNEFGVGGGTKTRFGDALHAMQAADAKLVGGDMRPFLSNARSRGPAILPALRQKYLDVENAIKQPVSDPSGYSSVPELLKQRDELKRQIDRATQYTSTAAPILQRQSGELADLHEKLVAGRLSGSERQRYEELARLVPGLSGFRQQLGN